MAEAVIVESTRSAIGERHGALSGVHPADLSAQVLNALVQARGQMVSEILQRRT